jgi:hypothetical protein
MTTDKEMKNAFELFGKYVKPKNSRQLSLINTGGNTYVLGLRDSNSGAYSTLGNHLSKKEMTQTLWDFTKVLSALKYGDLEFR